MSAPVTRLLTAGLIAAAGLALAGCAADALPTTEPETPTTEEASQVERDAKSFDSAKQYTETLYPGTPGTIFVPTTADYEALDAAIADALCGQDSEFRYPCEPTKGVDYAAMLKPGSANFDNVFDDDGSVWFSGGYEVYKVDVDGQPAEEPDDTHDAYGRYDLATGQITEMH